MHSTFQLFLTGTGCLVAGVLFSTQIKAGAKLAWNKITRRN